MRLTLQIRGSDKPQLSAADQGVPCRCRKGVVVSGAPRTFGANEQPPGRQLQKKTVCNTQNNTKNASQITMKPLFSTYKTIYNYKNTPYPKSTYGLSGAIIHSPPHKRLLATGKPRTSSPDIFIQYNKRRQIYRKP